MQSKKEKPQRKKQTEGNPKAKNKVLERLKHMSWWGWSTGLDSSAPIKQF